MRDAQIRASDGIEVVRDAEYVSMGLFNRKKQATERVQDLKTRVESLRKVDDEHRALTLDDFLRGDDTVTSRSEPRYKPAELQEPPAPPDEGDLEAELQRYLQRHEGDDEGLEAAGQEVAEIAEWGFDAPVSEAPQTMRPISIDEFPPLPQPEERYGAETDVERDTGASAISDQKPSVGSSYDAPRLSAEEEAALIAELQRFVQPEPAEQVEPTQAVPDALAADDFSWDDSSVEMESVELAPERAFDIMDMAAVDYESPVEELAFDGEEPEPTVVRLEDRTYVEPPPRHWPSVPLSPEDEGAVKPETEPAPWPKAAGDWEPL